MVRRTGANGKLPGQFAGAIDAKRRDRIIL